MMPRGMIRVLVIDDSAFSRQAITRMLGTSPLVEVVRGASPYVVLMIAGLALLIAFPELATWLPYSSGFGR